MTLREFIDHEIIEDHVFDLEEFGTKIAYMEWEDGVEIEPEEFEYYLDYNLDSVAIIHNFGASFHIMYYKISIAYKED